MKLAVIFGQRNVGWVESWIEACTGLLCICLPGSTAARTYMCKHNRAAVTTTMHITKTAAFRWIHQVCKQCPVIKDGISDRRPQLSMTSKSDHICRIVSHYVAYETDTSTRLICSSVFKDAWSISRNLCVRISIRDRSYSFLDIMPRNMRLSLLNVPTSRDSLHARRWFGSVEYWNPVDLLNLDLACHMCK